MEILELAKRFDCPNIALRPGPAPEEFDQVELLSILHDRLLELSRLKGRHEIDASLEGHANTIIEKP
ncbi:MAG: hypothetical protein ACUVTL_09410 [Thermoproteota archaeon]